MFHIISENPITKFGLEYCILYDIVSATNWRDSRLSKSIAHEVADIVRNKNESVDVWSLAASVSDKMHSIDMVIDKSKTTRWLVRLCLEYWQFCDKHNVDLAQQEISISEKI